MRLRDSFPPKAELASIPPLELDFSEDEIPTRPDLPKPQAPSLTEAERFALKRLERNWIASSPEDRRLIQAVAVRVRAGIDEKP